MSLLLEELPSHVDTLKKIFAGTGSCPMPSGIGLDKGLRPLNIVLDAYWLGRAWEQGRDGKLSF